MQAAATSWLDSSRQAHIRVYAASSGKITERCWDKDHWYTGAFSEPGEQSSATSWVDGSGQVHIRVYVDSGANITEYCWDKDSWYRGGYTPA
jgi:hypothetical protein